MLVTIIIVFFYALISELYVKFVQSTKKKGKIYVNELSISKFKSKLQTVSRIMKK